MKLNHECIRDLMLYIEENLPYGSYIYIHQVEIGQYNQLELTYAADKLYEAFFIEAERVQGMHDEIPSIKIFSITWDGHNFLDNIRDDKVWSTIKKKSSIVASASLQTLSQIGMQVLTGMITGQ